MAREPPVRQWSRIGSRTRRPPKGALFESADRASDTHEPPADHLSAALCIAIFLIDAAFGRPKGAQGDYPRRRGNITEAKGRSAETRMDNGSPTRARTWDLRIDMASVVKRAREALPSKHHAGRASPIGEATGSSVTTVDQTDMRALVSRKTVFRHGAASL